MPKTINLKTLDKEWKCSCGQWNISSYKLIAFPVCSNCFKEYDWEYILSKVEIRQASMVIQNR